MRMRLWVGCAVLSLSITSIAFSQTEPPQSSIDAAIRKLQSSSFIQRELGQKQLAAIGIPALDALRRASKSTDAETKRRLDELIRTFEGQLLTKQILAPKEIHLKLDGVTVQQAIAELTRVSAYPVQFLGDATKLSDQKITFDTGKTTFWQAFDQFCDHVGLMERVDLTRPIDASPYRNAVYYDTPGQLNAGPIIVTPRGNQKSIVSYAGAVKTELRISKIADTKESALTFVVSAEPRLAKAGIVATPQFAKIVDQNNRPVELLPETPIASAKNVAASDIDIYLGIEAVELPPRHVQMRVKSQTQLKEVVGSLAFQLEMQNEVLAKVENVLHSEGKTVDGVNGGGMKVLSAVKQDNGNVEVQVWMVNLTSTPLGGIAINRGNAIPRINGRRILGSASRADMPDLLDAKGQKYLVSNIPSASALINNGMLTRTATIVYQPNPGQTEPRDLVLFGAKTHTIAVPFRFEKLTVPSLR